MVARTWGRGDGGRSGKRVESFASSVCVCTRVPVHVCVYVCACTHMWVPMHAHTHVCVCTLSRVRLCDPTDCSPPGSYIHEILQAKILEWFAISSSG